MQHKDEISYGSKYSISNSDSIKSIDQTYEMLLGEYKKYLSSLEPEEARKLELATKIYNSSFFIAINDMIEIEGYRDKTGKELWNLCMQDKDFRDKIPSRYEKSRDFSKNPFSREEDRLFREESKELIDYSSEESFMESLKNVYDIIKRHSLNLTLPEDIEVFRGIASDKTDLSRLSKSSIISTSLDEKEAKNFAGRDHTKYKYLCYITAKKGTPFLMFLTDQARKQKEVMFLDENINIKKIGFISRKESNSELNGLPIPVVVYDIEASNELEKKKGQNQEL